MHVTHLVIAICSTSSHQYTIQGHLKLKSHLTYVILPKKFISLLVARFDIELSCLVVKFHLKLSHLQMMETTFHRMEWWLKLTQNNDLATNKSIQYIWAMTNLNHPSTWKLALPFQMFEYGKIFKLCNLFSLKQFAQHFLWWPSGENLPKSNYEDEGFNMR